MARKEAFVGRLPLRLALTSLGLVLLLALAGQNVAAQGGDPVYLPLMLKERNGPLLPTATASATRTATASLSPTVSITMTPTRTATATPTRTMTATATRTATVTPTTARFGWPDTTNGVHIWNDQLASGMTEAQIRFAAEHYVGSQKLTRSAAEHLRQYNPAFRVLHYRLGAGLGYRTTSGNCQPTGDYIHIIEGDEWIQEWPGEGGVQSAWFWPYAGSARALMCEWGWYLMNLDDAGWRTYWTGEVLRQLAANGDDGVFADSLSVPNALGASSFSPPLPAYDPPFEEAWARRIERWMVYVKGRLGEQYLLVPNAGSWITTRDTLSYVAADGVMIEGFAAWGPGSFFDLVDWQLQMNRILSMERLNKGIIAQSYLYDAEDTSFRLFVLSSYLLVKGSHTYINVELDMAPEWFPEYAVAIGAPLDALPADVSAWWVPAWGVYRREYSGGMTLVNPTETARTVTLTGSWCRVMPQGGGYVPGDGDVSAWHLDCTPATKVSLPAHSGAVLLRQ